MNTRRLLEVLVAGLIGGSACTGTADVVRLPDPALSVAPAALRALPAGERPLAGADWLILPGKALRVTGEAPIEVPVGTSAPALRFLHTFEPGPTVKAWQQASFEAKGKGAKPVDPPVVLRYVVRYADGETIAAPVRFGEGIHALVRDDFFDRYDGFYTDLLWSRIAWGAPTGAQQGQRACLYAMRWPNPRPQKQVASITIAGTDAGTAWVFAASVDDASASGRCLYVATNGNDCAAGDYDHPFASLGKAVEGVRPGDTVYVRGGRYAVDRRIRLATSGTTNAWITVSAFPGETPILDASGFACAGETPITNWTPLATAILSLGGQSHVRVQGLHIEHSIAYGIATETGAHQEVLFNTIFRTYHTGIWGTGKDVRVIGNTLIRACDTKTFYAFVERFPSLLESPFMREIKAGHDRGRRHRHECLDIGSSQSERCEAAYNEVAGGDKEGIDCKGGPAGVRIHHNFVHDVTMWTGIYIDAWTQLMRDVEVDHNIVWRTAGTGISVASEGGSGFENVRVHHNLSIENGFSGLLLSACNQDGFKKNVRFEHNTVYRNGTNLKNANAEGGLHIGSEQAEDIGVHNNIFAGNRDYGIARNVAKSPAEMGIAISHNLVQPAAAAGTKVFPAADPEKDARRAAWIHEPGANAVHGDPMFVDAGNWNFRLQARSPAIGAGLAADGKPCDLGAFPGEDKTVLALQSFLDRGTEERITALWKRAMRIGGVRCAYQDGAVPHVTTGSWRVPPGELGRAQSALAALAGQVAPVAVRFTLKAETTASGAAAYYLIPDRTPELLAYHQQVDKRLGFDFERFRPNDVPGQWAPHLTLFAVPKDKASECAPIVEELRKITDGRIERLGLVLFGPIRTVGELELPAP